MGSFSSALSWRIPQGISIRKGEDSKAARSICPHCGTKLGVADLVPLFSWLFSKGRCRHCQAQIGIRYPLIEVAAGLGAAGFFMGWEATPHLAVLVLMMPFLLALLVIDLEHMILPDELTLICGVLGLFHVFLLAGGGFDLEIWLYHLGSAVFYALLMFVLAKMTSFVLKKDAMGFGDVKFCLVAGLLLGTGYLPAFLVLSGLFGVLSGLVLRKMTGAEQFPFGPALILSLYVCLVLQGLGIVPLVGV